MLELKLFTTVFAAIFIAELGDKTQLATLLFAADKSVNKLTVFAAAALALVITSGIGVMAGGLVSEYINEKILAYIAGIGFILIGAYSIYQA